MKAVLIIAAISGSGYHLETKEYPMPSLEACVIVLKETKLEVCKGGDCEAALTVTCATREQND